MLAGPTQGVDTSTLTNLAFSATAGTLVEQYDFFKKRFQNITPYGVIFVWIN
jgi:hypothetical protein